MYKKNLLKMYKKKHKDSGSKYTKPFINNYVTVFNVT